MDDGCIPAKENGFFEELLSTIDRLHTRTYEMAKVATQMNHGLFGNGTEKDGAEKEPTCIKEHLALRIESMYELIGVTEGILRKL